ncbi:jg9369 [Pararge aegeria aegeria]|uniref:Jg9369 protein n=1 Tax=Pararge aegeria aegeria TaxID=348720 RepID=A0A8S4S009_9NEOP|nr:jg9369 [Pararge aegeria aegeria]
MQCRVNVLVPSIGRANLRNRRRRDAERDATDKNRVVWCSAHVKRARVCLAPDRAALRGLSPNTLNSSVTITLQNWTKSFSELAMRVMIFVA